MESGVTILGNHCIIEAFTALGNPKIRICTYCKAAFFMLEIDIAVPIRYSEMEGKTKNCDR